LHHFDFYRFHDPREWIDAGFRETFNGLNVSLVEWPEKAGDLLPPPDIEIVLSASGSGRSVSLRASSPIGIRLAERAATLFRFSPATS